jgi:hypothetical protein
MNRLALRFTVLLAAASTASPASAQAQSAATPSADPRTEARRHFDLGVAHIDRAEWSAALAEFMTSRQLFPTKTNTKNSAICLRKVGRFVEALDTFQSLLTDFHDLSPSERASVEAEIDSLRVSIGTIDIHEAPADAMVTIDSIDRGPTPLAGPVRLAAGRHAVRITKDGWLPFEAEVDLGGQQEATVEAHMAMLTQAGRLRVSERDGRPIGVVVDGVAVGTAPWEGALSPGTHTIFARGEGALGTQPAQVAVVVDRVSDAVLVAEELRAALRIEADDPGVELSIDGVSVGRAAWEGRLRSGPHRITAERSGDLPFTRDLSLGDGSSETLHVTLEPLVRPRAGLTIELAVGAPIGLLWGGDVVGACAGACSRAVSVGAMALVRGLYETSSGFAAGVHLGGLVVPESLHGRPEALTPVGLMADNGVVDDALRLSAVLIGGDVQYATRGPWRLTVRFTAGVLVGTANDARTGTFVDGAGVSYGVEASSSGGATYLYAGPQVRVGRRLGDRLSVSIGAHGLVLAALTATPSWNPLQPVAASQNPAHREGEGTFPGASITGPLMVLATPEIEVGYDF